MKNIKRLFFLFCSFILLLSSCQKPIIFVEGSGPSGSRPQTSSSGMSAKVDGRLVEFRNVGAQQTDALGTMVIAGSSETENISITIAEYSGAKTYDIEKNSVLAIYIKNSGTDSNKDYYIATTGSVTITSVTDKLVSGTFTIAGDNFDMSGRKVITEGKFTSNLIKQ